jgi:uncharacterized repeat protein (TIGR03803 family)
MERPRMGRNACTTSNATNNCGTLFKTTPSGETTILHSFGPTYHEPIAPSGALIQGTDGALYGTTPSGGGANAATGGLDAARCSSSRSRANLDRACVRGDLEIGRNGPSQYLIQASDGNIYGTTGSGGTYLGDLRARHSSSRQPAS